jgi:hypothetical protein
MEKYIEIIMNHLNSMEDETLKARLESLKGKEEEMFDYVKSQAQKEAKNGCACIEDTKVYSWAREFYIDYDRIKEEMKKQVNTYNPDKATQEVKPVVKKEVKLNENKKHHPKQVEQDRPKQSTLFDFI